MFSSSYEETANVSEPGNILLGAVGGYGRHSS